jgi:hypothetical protein
MRQSGEVNQNHAFFKNYAIIITFLVKIVLFLFNQQSANNAKRSKTRLPDHHLTGLRFPAGPGSGTGKQSGSSRISSAFSSGPLSPD